MSLKDGQLFYKQVLTRNEYGLITSDSTTKDCPDMNKMQNYIYDELNRLTQWSATNESTRSLSYDRSGNRLSKQIGTTISNYNYSSDIYSNQILESIDYDDKTRTFDYNSLGSVASVYDSVYSTQTNSLLEEFKYDLSGRVSQYIKYDDSFTPCDSNSISYSANKFVWKYRYSPFGGLESKRLYTSPTGDDCGTGHSWEYFLRGVGGSLLSHYNGRQTSKDTCGVSNRRIYFYVDSYYVPGTSMKVLADGEKIYNLSDQNGNIRAVAKEGADCARQYYDYTPFGEVITSLDPNLPAEGFGGNRTKREMDYSMMGARLYDKESGRFLSVDPLSGMFKTLTPYQYAYNSPISFSDPSGLAPKKEGSGDKIQVLSTLFSGLGLADYGSWEFNAEFSSTRRKVVDKQLSPLSPEIFHYEYDFDVNISFSYNISGGSGLSFGTSQSLSGGISIGSGSGPGGNPVINGNNSRSLNPIVNYGGGSKADPKSKIIGNIEEQVLLELNHIRQEGNSCFPVALQMVLNYLKPLNNISWQCNFDYYSKEDGVDFTSNPESANMIYESGFPESVFYRRKPVAMYEGLIIESLRDGKPVIFTYSRPDGSDHAIVITGFTITNEDIWFEVLDPGFDKHFLYGKMDWTGTDLFNKSYFNRSIKLKDYNIKGFLINDVVIFK